MKQRIKWSRWILNSAIISFPSVSFLIVECDAARLYQDINFFRLQLMKGNVVVV